MGNQYLAIVRRYASVGTTSAGGERHRKTGQYNTFLLITLISDAGNITSWLNLPVKPLSEVWNRAIHGVSFPTSWWVTQGEKTPNNNIVQVCMTMMRVGA